MNTGIIIGIIAFGVILLICVIIGIALLKKSSKSDLSKEISNSVQRILDNLGVNNNNQKLLIENFQNSISQQMQSAMLAQKNQLETLYQQLMKISNLNETKIENMRNSMEKNLLRLQADNNQKLEQMRNTVEEKLQSTLEKRLGESFKIVSERLEKVHQGLGEMQNLASGVGDLKKVLTNVKTRGIWGEAQLDAIIKQIMTHDQYERNVAIKRNSLDRVEYAIKFPGKDDDSRVLLPIDAKFPLEDYQRLLEAQEIGNVTEIEKQSKALEISIKKSAKLISDKYLHPPKTTDFAIMFIPIEGLYAEILRKPGIVEVLQREYRIVITSPTTLSAILNSLQMGFRTIAIEKRSSEVWKLLESVKLEFLKFSDLLGKTKIKLDQASQAISGAEHRSKMIQKKLSKIEIENSSTNPIESIEKEEN